MSGAEMAGYSHQQSEPREHREPCKCLYLCATQVLSAGTFQEFLSLGRQLSYKALYFLCNETKVRSIPSTHTGKLGVLVPTRNSHAGEADGGPLGCQSTQ